MTSKTVPASPWFERIVDEDDDDIDHPLFNLNPMFRGHANAGCTVALFAGDQEIDRVESDNQGNWLWMPRLAELLAVLPEAFHPDSTLMLVARAIDRMGNVSDPSPALALNVEAHSLQ